MVDIVAMALRRRGGGMALLALGFRPFYLAAGMFAVFAVPLWIAVFTGVLPSRLLPNGLVWHSHEMVFGFATAVIAGFLLTAVRNWTGRATPVGTSLGTLVGIWLLGRILALSGPELPAAIVDMIFLPAIGVAIAVPIRQSRNTRNIKILVILAALTAANLTFHLAGLGMLPAGTMRISTIAALDIIALLIAIVGGRVIPAFTANAIASANPRRLPGVELVAVGSLLLILVADVLAPIYALNARITAALFFLAAFAQAVRLWLWQPQRTYRDALLLMLPVAYFWIPVMLTLRGLAALNMAPDSAGLHALALGAMAGLMLAMMMRSALGHTGRSLVAGPAEIAAFSLIQAAAIARVVASYASGESYRILIVLSTLLWVLAFSVFLGRYWSVLTRPRIDGHPG